MFARLKSHADKVDSEIQDLEKKLDMKTKILFSIVNVGVSDSSVEYMRELVEELEQMSKVTSSLLSECKIINFNNRSHMKKYTENMELMKEQVARMENHLSEFGYTKCDVTREARTSDAQLEDDIYSGYSDNDNY